MTRPGDTIKPLTKKVFASTLSFFSAKGGGAVFDGATVLSKWEADSASNDLKIRS